MKKGTLGKKLDAEDHWRSKVLRNWCGHLFLHLTIAALHTLPTASSLHLFHQFLNQIQ